ncbi:MAG TPA: polysaccharide deacetylase family protein [Sphingomicrobium sp.]|nr:polysaccharide deacetylase family protein [Sphingomicrobium sp.]
MTTARKRLLLASIHDVSPRFEGEVDRLADVLRSYVGDRIALLVVPNHWGDAPIVTCSPFAARLRGWAEAGFEIFLHGFYHRDEANHNGAADRFRASFMTAGEGEFLGLDQHDAATRIATGRALLEDIVGRPIDGFVAPAWLYGAGALQALAEARVPIAEDHMRVWSPATGQRLARGPVITWASRTRFRLASSLAAAAALRHAPLDVLRVGVHPPDIRHPVLVRSIERTLTVAARTRRPSAYRDLLNS